ncbi:MAG: VacJ family lipoprotein [Burkholderiales bacterium]
MTRLPFLLAAACLMSGCAAGPNPKDPYEKFNRKVHSFNEGFDKIVAKPVAKAYDKVLPDMVQTGIGNFFSNLGVLVTALNDAAQLKGSKVPVDIMRFTTNLVFGLGGLLDVATELKIENRNEDFGQTLGYWGVGSGPYLVLPILGPSSVRDGVALPVDYYLYPTTYVVDEPREKNSLTAVRFIDARAKLLGAGEFLEQSGMDKYSFIRDAVIQRREYQVHDGEPPISNEPGATRPKTLLELEEEDFGDEPPSGAPTK